MKKYDILLKQEARESLFNGINKLAEAVKSTLGPGGRVVVIKAENEKVYTTKDGVTVAKSILLRDVIEQMGAMMIREAAQKTGERAGDGTSTSTVLAQAFITEAFALIKKGHSPVDICNAWDAILTFSLNDLRHYIIENIELQTLINIGIIATNGDKELGKLVAETVNSLGKRGVTAIEDSPTQYTYAEKVHGLQVDSGYLSPYFINAPKIKSIVYAKGKILLIDGILRNLGDIQSILDVLYKSNTPLIIMANEIDPRIVTLFIANCLKNGWQGALIKTPLPKHTFTDTLEDIATVCNAEVIKSNDGKIDRISVGQLGNFDKIEINEIRTTIISSRDNNERVNTTAKLLEDSLQDTLTSNEREYIDTRLNRLLGGVAVINVGGYTMLEVRERKDRVDDAVRACKAAMESGIVPGGGTVLANIGDKAEKLNYKYSKEFGRALKSPLLSIWANAGIKRKFIPFDLRTFGIDALTNQEVNLIDKGIIDPALVVQEALKNALSVAKQIILTEAVLYQDHQKKVPDFAALRANSPQSV